MLSSNGVLIFSKVGKAAQRLGDEATECPACARLCGRLLRIVKGSIEGTIDERGFSSDAVQQGSLAAREAGRKESSRKDEDLKKAITEVAVQGRDVGTRKGQVQHFAVLNAELARAQEHRFLVRYEKAQVRVGNAFTGGFLGLAEDGARFDQPPQEFQFYLAGMIKDQHWHVLKPQEHSFLFRSMWFAREGVSGLENNTPAELSCETLRQ